MSIYLKVVTASKILELIQQFLSETEQQWLNDQLNQLLRKPHLTLTQKQALTEKLCGAWANDDTIPAIFQEIEQQRMLNEPREVSF